MKKQFSQFLLTAGLLLGGLMSSCSSEQNQDETIAQKEKLLNTVFDMSRQETQDSMTNNALGRLTSYVLDGDIQVSDFSGYTPYDQSNVFEKSDRMEAFVLNKQGDTSAIVSYEKEDIGFAIECQKQTGLKGIIDESLVIIFYKDNKRNFVVSGINAYNYDTCNNVATKNYDGLSLVN